MTTPPSLPFLDGLHARASPPSRRCSCSRFGEQAGLGHVALWSTGSSPSRWLPLLRGVGSWYACQSVPRVSPCLLLPSAACSWSLGRALGGGVHRSLHRVSIQSELYHFCCPDTVRVAMPPSLAVAMRRPVGGLLGSGACAGSLATGGPWARVGGLSDPDSCCWWLPVAVVICPGPSPAMPE